MTRILKMKEAIVWRSQRASPGSFTYNNNLTGEEVTCKQVAERVLLGLEVCPRHALLIETHGTLLKARNISSSAAWAEFKENHPEMFEDEDGYDYW
jgi:hypothetical protein